MMKPEMFSGHHRDICSVDDFITYTAGSGSGLCLEFSPGPVKKNARLRLFWYSSWTSKSYPAEEKIMACLLSLDYWVKNALMIQFWTPKRSSSGAVVLTVSEQPFAIGELCKGLCRYRYSCIQQDIEAENTTNAKVGPVGKVFTQEYPEYHAGTLSSLSNDDFAKSCGIGDDWNYLALPIFESGHSEQCIGVLEFLSYGHNYYDYLYVAVVLKKLGVDCRRPKLLKCDEVRCSVLKSTVEREMLHRVRMELKSPLIQIWLPCMCDTTSMSTQLLSTWSSMGSSMKYRLEYEYLLLPHGSSSGKIQNHLVGRAYYENKACFIRDARKLSISDYPLVGFIRHSGLEASFVVPLKSVHPELHCLVLEVFLPPLQKFDNGKPLAELKSLLSTVAQKLSKCNAAFGLQENEDFCISNSHSDDDNVIYFDVHRCYRRMATNAAIGHEIEDIDQNCGIQEPLKSCDDVVIVQEDEVAADSLEGDEAHDLQMIEDIQEFHSLDQPVEANDHSKIIQEDTARTSREAFMNAEAEIILDAIPSGEEVEAAAETLDGELVNSHEMLGNNRKEQQLGTSETKNHLNGQDMAENLRQTCTIDQDEITLDIINQYRGRAKLDDVAKELKVSRATFKRRCRKFGIKRWPYYNKNEVHNIQPSAGLPKTILVEAGGRVIQESEISQCSNYNETAAASSFLPGAKGRSTIVAGNQDIGQGFSLIVKATCRGDTAKFPFYSNSGIEELSRELVKRFELEVGRLKIKYKDEDDDGEWIILSCSEDLLFHMETLKASGQSTMRLSVFPLTL